MYCVDVLLICKGCISASESDTPKLSQQDFYSHLVEEVCTRNDPRISRDSQQNQSLRLSSLTVLRATRREKSGNGGKLTKFCAHCRCCMYVKAHLITVCS